MMSLTSRSDIQKIYFDAAQDEQSERMEDQERQIAMLRHIIKVQYHAIKHLEAKLREHDPV
jgi:asparagine synthetase A